MMYKIYKLLDPITNETRYIGRTNQKLSYRLRKHINAKDKSHRVNWIKSLKIKGLEPLIELICETNSFHICCKLESFYIKKYKDNGHRLVNMTDGGDGSIGFKHSKESIEKMKNSYKNRYNDIDNLRMKGNLQWENTPDEVKILNILNQKGRKSIKQLTINGEFVKEYISLREIERELGFFRANISPCLKGIFKQAYGFKWIYSD